MVTIGFVILSHRGPRQLRRLVAALNVLYDDPPIACHHDFAQTPFSTADFPHNVRFVEPSSQTSWGKWVVVKATLAALSLLYADDGPDWFVLLSAADYPVRSGREVLRELVETEHDAFLDARPLGRSAGRVSLIGAPNPKLGHFDAPGNVRLKWQLYLGAELWIPIVRRAPRWRLGRYTLRLPFAARGPFDAAFGCFYGDHWFTANRRTAGVLLCPTQQHKKLQRYLRMRTCVDECYYQSVLCNAPGLSICLDNKRFAEWNCGGAHPMELTERELPEAMSSGAHFARKFAYAAPVLDEIDTRLKITHDGAPPQPNAQGEATF